MSKREGSRRLRDATRATNSQPAATTSKRIGLRSRQYATDLRDEIVVLTKRNRAIAAIVPLKKTDRESVALSGHPEFLKIIERSRADFRSGRVISLEAMKDELKVRQSPNKRLQPTKARRRTVKKRSGGTRLRG